MKCPKCNQKMELRAEAKRYNFHSKPKKEYLQRVYWCKDDDIWIDLQVPSVGKN